MKAVIAVVVAVVIVAAAAAVVLMWDSGADAEEELVAVVEVSSKEASVGQGIRFSADQSSGDIRSYQWDFGDGTTSDEKNPTHKFKKPGRYNVTLTVQDDDGNEHSDSVLIYVNAPPTAAFSVSDDTPKVYQTITFRGGESSDPDGSIGEYLWDFGDGKSADSAEAQHAYNEPGKYRVKLTVKDAQEEEDTATLDLEVSLRTFLVHWTIMNETSTRQNTTAENDSENITFSEMNRDNLIYVSFHLTWDDRQPVNVVSEGNDNFTLSVRPPGSSERNLSSEFESIMFEWSLASVPEEFSLEARTEADARDSIDMDDFETSEGRGDWWSRVALGDAGDGLLQDGGIYPDTGNSWRLDVTYQYYVLTISEVVT